MSEFTHRPVLLDECIELLNIRPDGIYLDGTLGRAGHSREIAGRLSAGRLICVDRDQAALDAQVESVVSGGEGLEIVCRRTGDGHKLYFVMNFTDQERKLPACFEGQRDLLTGKSASRDTVLKKYDVCIIEQ